MLYGIFIVFCFVSTVLGIHLYIYKNVRPEHKILIEDMATWLLFNIAFALAPLVCNVLIASLTGSQPTFVNIFSKGELLLISTAVSADAAGRLLTSNSKDRFLKLMAAGGCLLLLFFSSVLFTVISTGTGKSAPDFAANISIFVFLATFFTGGCCIYLSSLKG